jgi:transcription elongation factor Elf1
MEEDRFKKIEEQEIISGIVRKKEEKDRFEHIETGDQDIKEKEIKEKKYFECPKCKRNNPIDSLYCIYCGYVFLDKAEKVDKELEVYEIRCPSCGKTGNRNQKRCIWCGYSFVPDEEEILRKGSPVEITVDGVKYSSKDPYLPEYIKKALIRIKKENMKPEEIEKLVNEIKVKKAEASFKIERDIEKRKHAIRGFILMAVGGIFVSIFRFLILSNNLSVWIYIFPVIGTILIIIGMINLSFGLNSSEIEEFTSRFFWRWWI